MEILLQDIRLRFAPCGVPPGSLPSSWPLALVGVV
jgi:hypothetical protein